MSPRKLVSHLAVLYAVMIPARGALPAQQTSCTLDSTAAWARVNRAWSDERGTRWSNDSLRRELLALRDRDQAARKDFGARVGDSIYGRQLMALDSTLAAAFTAILNRHGLPTRSMVGAAGADAAMLIVQHNWPLQERVLALAKAAPHGEISLQSLALLEDRVLVHQGKPQVYGSQFSIGRDQIFHLDSTTDLPGLVARRARMGLPPLIQYICLLEEAGMHVAPLPDPAILLSEFIASPSPTPAVHASTIVETPQGLVAAWFGGSAEGAQDVGIWVSRKVDGKWLPPRRVDTGYQMTGDHEPCWNPVLFLAAPDRLLLFYKVGPSPATWWGVMQSSRDGGVTWSEARRLPDGILGPIKNKPVWLPGGALISPSSTESPDRPSRWRIHFELTRDTGRTWTVINPTPRADTITIDAIQPSILVHRGGQLEAVGRTRNGRLFETSSSDTGRSWSPLVLTSLPNPNSGIDAVTLRDGRQLVVYNHSTTGRSPLNVAVSRDGKQWDAAVELETVPGEYSYPAVIQTSDGLVHLTYTWRRERIKHVVLDPRRFVVRAMP